MTTDTTRTVQLTKPPMAVQIIAILGFTGFAIPVSIVAMSKFGALGLLLAAFLAWQWTRLAGLDSNGRLTEAVKLLKPQVADSAQPTGNASFDAYRDDLMQRLEMERENFNGFLLRLRDAKDKTEFDTFMTEREKMVRQTRDTATA